MQVQNMALPARRAKALLQRPVDERNHLGGTVPRGNLLQLSNPQRQLAGHLSWATRILMDIGHTAECIVINGEATKVPSICDSSGRPTAISDKEWVRLCIPFQLDLWDLAIEPSFAVDLSAILLPLAMSWIVSRAVFTSCSYVEDSFRHNLLRYNRAQVRS